MAEQMDLFHKKRGNGSSSEMIVDQNGKVLETKVSLPLPQRPQHSEMIGGSNCERRMACPGSAALEAQMPKEKSSKYAEEGSMLHSVMHQILEHDKTPEELIGFTENGHILTQALIDEMINPALVCFDELQTKYGDFEYLSEVAVGYPDTVAYGTADIVGGNDTYTIVVDWKFGRGVSVKGSADNKQLLFYAGGASETPETEDLFSPHKPVVLAIIQPAMATPLTYGEVGSNALSHFKGELHKTIRKIEANCSDTNLGPWCRWCRAQPICPAKLAAAEDMLGTNPNGQGIGSARLGFLVGQATEMEEWVRSIMSAAKAELEKGREVEGYKLVQKRATRQWSDEVHAKRVLRSLGRFRVKDITETKLISPAKAEKLIKSNGSKVDLDDMIVSQSSGTTMTTVDDRRAAVTPRAGLNLDLPDKLEP